MGIEFIGSAVGDNTYSLADYDITLPTCQENDVVIVAVGDRSGTNIDGGVNTTGYTDFVDLFYSGTRDMNLSVLWKRMGSTPDTVVNVKGLGTPSVAVAYVLRGVSTTTVADVTPTSETGYGSPPNPVAITPVTPGSFVVVCGTGTTTDSSVTAPVGYSDQAQHTYNGSNDAVIAVVSRLWTGQYGEEDPPGWTGWTGGTLQGHCSATIAIRPEEPALTFELQDSAAEIAGQTVEPHGTIQVPQIVAEVVSSGFSILTVPQVVAEVIYTNPDAVVPSTSTAKPFVFFF